MRRRATLGMGGAAVLVSASILLSRLLGLLRESVLAALLGISAEGSIYRNAFLLPDFLNYLLAGGFLSITLIPVLARRFEEGQEQAAWQDFTAVFRVVAAAIITLTALLWIAADPLIEALFPRLGSGSVTELVELTRIALPAQIFFVLGALFMAVSYSRKRFFYPALAPVVYNLGIIGGGLLGAVISEPSPHAFVWGAVAGAAIGNFGLQWIGAHRAGLRWSRGPSREAVREYLLLALPLMIGQSVAVLDEQFPRLFGQLVDEGTTAALSFARMLNMLPVGLIAQAASVASYPFLVSLAARGDRTELGTTTLKAARTAAVAGMAATAFLIAAAQPFVRVVYQWGRFGDNDVEVVSRLLVAFSFSIPAWSIHQVVARWFYANRRMWTPVVIGTAATVVAIPLALLLTTRSGAVGIAWASTIVMWIYTLALAGKWVRDTDQDHGRALVVGMARALPAAASAALVGRMVVDALGGSDPLTAVPALVVGGVAAGVTFFGVGSLFRVAELTAWRRRRPRS